MFVCLECLSSAAVGIQTDYPSGMPAPCHIHLPRPFIQRHPTIPLLI